MTPRSLSWPTARRLGTGIGGALLLALVFFPIYIGCAAVSAARASPWQLYADWELALPFWPFMIVPYLSMFVLFLLPPFQLEETELRTLTMRLCVASLLGGTLFLILPAQIGFTPHDDAGPWQWIYTAIYRIDGPFNAVPSFHVIYTASILHAMIEVATPRLRRLYFAWLIAVCASTVLTHRHHLLDVAAGLAIASAVPVLWSSALLGRLIARKETARMKSMTRAAAVLVLVIAASAAAQEPASADHEALRKIKTDVLTAINTRNLAGMDKVLHKPAMVTVITQDAFTDAAALQTYYNGLFTRKLMRIGKIDIEADADELSQIYTGTFAVARGSTKESYDMADGRHFDLRGRWTATAIKDDGQWKLLAIHTGVNFVDNPVITAVEKSTAYFGAGGLALGLVLGFGLSLLVRRKHA